MIKAVVVIFYFIANKKRRRSDATKKHSDISLIEWTCYSATMSLLANPISPIPVNIADKSIIIAMVGADTSLPG